MGDILDQLRQVTCPDAELLEKCNNWISKLCESGGKAWSLRVPVDFNHDPDVLFSELIRRFEARENTTYDHYAPPPEGIKGIINWFYSDPMSCTTTRLQDVDYVRKNWRDGDWWAFVPERQIRE